MACRPVAPGLLFAEVRTLHLLHDAENLLAGGKHLAFRSGERRHDDALDGFRQRDERFIVAAQEVDFLVVEHDVVDGALDARDADLVERVVRFFVACEAVVRRKLDFRLRAAIEHGLRHDAERALMAEEQLEHAVACRRVAALPRAALAEPDHFARREHDFHAADEVRRMAGAGAADAPSIRADAAADDGRAVRGGIVRVVHADLVEHLVELLHVDARLHRDGTVDVIDFENLVHALHVEADALVERERAIGEAAAGAARDDRQLVLVRELHDFGDFLRAARQDDDVGDMILPALHRERCARCGAHSAVVHGRHDIFRPDDVFEFFDMIGDFAVAEFAEIHLFHSALLLKTHGFL